MAEPTADTAEDTTGIITTPAAAQGAPAVKLGNGVTIPWKIIIVALLAVLGVGGGTAGGFQIATKDYVDDCDKATNQAAIDREARLEKQLKGNKKAIKAIEVQGLNLTKTVGEIQETQHGQYARQEARRLTSHIANRARREAAYDRILERNKRRLKSGLEPCANLDCTD